jgi:hypothetical protein
MHLDAAGFPRKLHPCQPVPTMRLSSMTHCREHAGDAAHAHVLDRIAPDDGIADDLILEMVVMPALVAAVYTGGV